MDSSNKIKKIRRQTLSVKEKLKIIAEYEKGSKNHELSTRYNLSHSSVSEIIKIKEEIKEKGKLIESVQGCTSIKHVTAVYTDPFEQAMYNWVCEQKTKGESVNGPMMKSQAVQLYKEIYPNEIFKASDGWLAKFLKRHGLSVTKSRVDKKAADAEASFDFIEEFAPFVQEQGYTPDDIYSGKEFGLEYQLLLGRPIVPGAARRLKQKKDSLTAMLCANASGSHQIPLLVIGKSLKRRCSTGTNGLPLEYRTQNNAWMTSNIFMDWFQNIFIPSVTSRKPNGRFLLLLENSPIQSSEDVLNGIDERVSVLFFPANIRSEIPPMDQEIIPTTKKRYLLKFAYKLVTKDSNISIETFSKSWTVYNAMEILKDSWSSLSKSTLANAWMNLLPDMIPNFPETSSSTEESDRLALLLKKIPGHENVTSTEIEKWLKKNMKTWQLISDDEDPNKSADIPLTAMITEENCSSLNSFINKVNEKQKIKRRALSVQQKLNIIAEYEQGSKNHELCARYNLSHSTVSEIIRAREAIKEKRKLIESVEGSTSIKHLHAVYTDPFEQTMYNWICEKRMCGEPINGPMIKSQAIQFYEQIHPNEVFKASDGWLGKFMKRHGLRVTNSTNSTTKPKAEKQPVDTEASFNFIAEFAPFVQEQGYTPDDIYSGKEFGLEFQLLLGRPIDSRTEKSTSGQRQKKDCLTIMLCSNASGSHRIPLLVIGKSLKLGCYTGAEELPLNFRTHNNAWMNKNIFLDWFQNIFIPNVTSRNPNGRFLLLLENTPVHASQEILNAIDERVSVLFFPANVTNEVQPMDQGIISTTKRRYLLKFAYKLYTNDNISIETFSKSWTVYNAMEILKDSWNSLSRSTLANAWMKLLPNMIPHFPEASSSTEESDRLALLLKKIPGHENVTSTEIENWLRKKVKTWQQMNDDEDPQDLVNIAVTAMITEENCLSLNELIDRDNENQVSIHEEIPSSENVYEMSKKMLIWCKNYLQNEDDELTDTVQKIQNKAFDLMIDECI